LEKLISVKEAAILLGISPWTLFAWVSQGRIRYRKVGRRTMFTEEDLEDFVQVKPKKAA
jgi:excisionase family DNA binding protein